MDKLTLEHLAPYLPYGLKVYTDEKYNYKTFEIIQLSRESNCIWARIDKHNSGWISRFKPILRPLSDLTKGIEQESRYNVIIELIVNDTDTHCDAYDEWLESFIDNPEQSRIMQAPYEVFQELIKHHFDVFGLIDAGLAVDINTIDHG